jgi:hypothetical protein
MIKVMNLVGILAAPFTAVSTAQVSVARVAITVVAILMLGIAVILSKRGSIANEQAQGGIEKAAA